MVEMSLFPHGSNLGQPQALDWLKARVSPVTDKY